MALPLALWGHRLGGWLGAVAALAFGLTMPAWHLATGAGRLDTGSLPPTLLLLAALCLDAVTGQKPGEDAGSTWWRIALFGVCLALLGWWWPPGLLLAALWLPAFAGLALWRLRQRQGFRRLAWFISGASILALFSLLLLAPQLVAWLAAHLALLAKGAAGSGQVGGGIAELRSPGLTGLLQLAGGSVAGGVAGFAGLLLLFLRAPFRLAGFAPLLAACGLGLYVERFTPFAAPLLALGATVLILSPFQMAALRQLLPPAARYGLAFVLFLGLLTPGARFSLKYTPRPEVTQGMDAMALKLREAGRRSPDLLVWSWWDWGYFLQWRAGARTLFDGGSQGLAASFVAAHPLASPNDVLSARWMRFFAEHGPGMFTWLARRLGGSDEAAAWLQQAMSSPQNGGELLAQADLSHKDLQKFLYPDAKVAVFLPVEFLGLAAQWLPLSLVFEPVTDTAGPPADVFVAQGFSMQKVGGETVGLLPDAATAKGWPGRLPGVDLRTARLPGDVRASAQPLLLLSPESPLAYVAAGRVARSLGFRLLAPVRPRPRGFSPLWWRPETGGVWLLEPQPQN